MWLFIAGLRILHGARRMASFRPANRTHTTNQAASFDKSKDPEEFTNFLTGNHPRNPEISQMVTVLSKLCIHQLISTSLDSNNPSLKTFIPQVPKLEFIIVLQGPDRRWKLCTFQNLPQQSLFGLCKMIYNKSRGILLHCQRLENVGVQRILLPKAHEGLKIWPSD